MDQKLTPEKMGIKFVEHYFKFLNAIVSQNKQVYSSEEIQIIINIIHLDSRTAFEFFEEAYNIVITESQKYFSEEESFRIGHQFYNILFAIVLPAFQISLKQNKKMISQGLLKISKSKMQKESINNLKSDILFKNLDFDMPDWESLMRDHQQ